jgi:peptide/nickel transport system permease protein
VGSAGSGARAAGDDDGQGGALTVATVAADDVAVAAGGWRATLGANPALFGGLAIVGGVAVLALLAPLIAPFSPVKADPSASLLAPGGEHLLGTDPSGFDILSRLLYGARADLMIGLLGTIVAMGLGGAIGLGIGVVGGAVDAVVSRLVDLLQSIPLFVSALLLVTLFGQRMTNIIIAVTVVYLPLYVRTFRAETRTLQERTFVRAARIGGATELQVLWRHVLPNAMAPALGQWATSVGWAILMASGLGFVGAGLKPPTAEWGSMVSGGASLVATGEWWVAFFPGAAIALTVAGFALLSEGIEQRLDPRRRR